MNWIDFNNIKEDVLKTKGFFHFSFWVMFYFFTVLIDKSSSPIWIVMVDKLIDVIFYIFVVYINIIYLIPHFLQKRNLLFYFVSLVLLVVLLTPIQTFCFLQLYQQDSEVVLDIISNKRPMILLRHLFIGLMSTGYKVTASWFSMQNEKRELESQNLQSELKFLKSQINPHFFFNTLNNLYALTLKKSDLAPEIVLRLSEMMRYMLYESNEKEVSLEKEINYVKNYIELEKLRQGGNYEINFNLEGEVVNQKIAPLMFIPFLENSFKHGLDRHINSGYVHINLDLNETNVNLDIKNSKPKKIVEVSELKSGGIGLENVKRRLKLLYPEKHILQIIDNKDFFNVKLNIQLV